MAEEITKETFAHLVQLAALELDAQEAEYLRRELNHQLTAIHELEAIPLEADTPVTSHGVPYTPERTPLPRTDEVVSHPDPEQILSQAPEMDEGYIVVPDIKHEDLT